MPFEKGKSGNPEGRQKGSKNKKTEQWEMFAEWFLSSGMERLEEEMGKLEGKDFVYAVKDLLEYFKPKLARTDMNVKGDIGVTWNETKTYDSEG